MRQLLWSIGREYKSIFTDSGVLLIFLAGLVLYSMFYPLPYSTEVVKETPVIPVDQDNTTTSRKLMHWVEATEEIQLVEPTGDLAEAQKRVLTGDAEGVFVIPREFERDILRGKQATVSVYADACYFIIYRQIVSGAYKATATLSAGVEIRRYTAAGLTEKNAMQARDPLPIDTRPLFNPAGGYGTYVVPGVLILIMQQTLLIGIGMLGGARNEKEKMDVPCGLTGQSGIFITLVGRAMAYFSIYIMFPLFYLGVVFRIYHLPVQGSLRVIMLFMIPFVLAVVFLGLLLTTFFRTREMSIPALLFTSMPAVFLIGFAWPPESIPAGLRYLGLLFPSSAGCAGFLRINQMGATLYDVRHEWILLWGLALGYCALTWFFMACRAYGVFGKNAVVQTIQNSSKTV